jgi:zinc protease
MDAVMADFLKTGPDPRRAGTDPDAGPGRRYLCPRRRLCLANRYGEGLTVGLTIEDIESWDEALASVTEADVMAAAEKVLDRRNAVTGWLTRPEEEVAE